jgi:crotonobetainyl-CoA:carnitine CoA-transferase CaiB-like acyl-CoA transferase
MGYARRRAKAGMGCYLDLALSESPLGSLGEQFVSSSAGTQHLKIDGNRHPVYCPHGAFRTLGDDVWVTIAVTSNEEWGSLKTVLSDKTLENPCYEHAEGRKSSEGVLNRAISQWAGEREADKVVTLLQNAGVPSGKVLNNLELLNNPHLRDRGYFVKLHEKKWGPQIYDGQAIPGSQKHRSTWHSMRNVGEDNRSILTNLLGYTQKEFKTLKENGVVGSESFED